MAIRILSCPFVGDVVTFDGVQQDEHQMVGQEAKRLATKIWPKVVGGGISAVFVTL